MNKSIITRISLFSLTAILLSLPYFAGAVPGAAPPAGNVDANFNSVTINQGGATQHLFTPTSIFGAPIPSGNYVSLDNTSPWTCDNPATLGWENNFPCPVVIGSNSLFGGLATGTIYSYGAFFGGPGARTGGGVTIYTTNGGLTVDANANGGITLRDDWGNSGLNLAAWSGGIENNSLKTLGWDTSRPVIITDPHGLSINGPTTSQGHLRAPTIGGFGYKAMLRQTVNVGDTATLTRTCPFAGSIAVSCNFRTTSSFFGVCQNWNNTTNPLEIISLDQTAQWTGYSAGECTIRMQNQGGFAVCGEIEVQCWNPNE